MSRPIPPSFRGRTGPTKPLSHERLLTVCRAYKTLYEHYVAHGAPVTSDIYTTSLEIEREIIFWEQRSAKLHYEAKRQAARRRANRNELDAADPSRISSDFSDYADDDADLVAELPTSTKAALTQFKASHGVATASPDTPAFDTSGYKKSGLV